jgi:hypothetical protein
MKNLSNDTILVPVKKQLFDLIAEWQKKTGDTLNLTSSEILPLEYDYRNLIRKPDRWQPEYTIKKYFNVDHN